MEPQRDAAAHPWCPDAQASQDASLGHSNPEPVGVLDPGALSLSSSLTTTHLQPRGPAVNHYVPALTPLNCDPSHSPSIVTENVCSRPPAHHPVFAGYQYGSSSGMFGALSDYTGTLLNGGFGGMHWYLSGMDIPTPHPSPGNLGLRSSNSLPAFYNAPLPDTYPFSRNGLSESATYSDDPFAAKHVGFSTQEAGNDSRNVYAALALGTSGHLGIRQHSSSQGTNTVASITEDNYVCVSPTSTIHLDDSIAPSGPQTAHESGSSQSIPTGLASTDDGLTARATPERFPASTSEDRLEALLKGWQKSTGGKLSTWDTFESLRDYCVNKIRDRHGEGVANSIFYKTSKQVVGASSRSPTGGPSAGTEGGYTCPFLECGARHTRKHNHLLHIGAHLGMTDCRCEGCYKYFTASSIERHKKTCSKESP